MTRKFSIAALVMFCSTTLGLNSLQAATYGLFDYAFNINGVVTPAPGVPGGVNTAAFNSTTGLGSITLSIGTTGNHFVGLFVDHEIDAATNTFFNEFGTAVGAPPAGLSWEIDEPGFVFGNIYTHFTGSTAGGSLLDNTSAVPPGSPDDVSMALGWNFNLAAGHSATISYFLSTTPPASGFYLQQTDPASNASVYFSSALNVNVIPETGTSAWAMGCLAVLAVAGVKRLGFSLRSVTGKQA